MEYLCTKCGEELKVEDYDEIDICDGYFCISSNVTCKCGEKYTFYQHYKCPDEPSCIEVLDSNDEEI